MKTIEMEKYLMKPKRISVSSKRQITIPLEYCKELNIKNEVECIIKDNSIIIRPVIDTSQDNFADLILEDLIKEGYKGEKLLEEFKKRKNQIKNKIDDIIDEANKVAENEAPYYTTDDVFKEEYNNEHI